MLQGTLDTFSVGEVLELVGAAGASGVLHVHSDLDVGLVQCRDGAVSFASVGADSDFCDVLARGGFVPADDLRALATSSDREKDLKELLARHDVDSDRLQQFLAVQTEESVFELDCWRTGDLRLEPDEDAQLGGILRYPTTELLTSIAERKREWETLVATLGSPDHIVHQAPMGIDDEGEMRVSRSQLALLSRIDGRRSVRELSRHMGTGLFQTCKAVAALVDIGLAAMRSDRADGVPSPAPEPVPAAPEPVPQRAAPEVSDAPAAAAPAERGVAPEFVEAGDGPARDLIVRLLSAVKEEL